MFETYLCQIIRLANENARFAKYNFSVFSNAFQAAKNVIFNFQKRIRRFLNVLTIECLINNKTSNNKRHKT